MGDDVTAVELTGTGLAPEDVIAVARAGVPVQLAPEARDAMAASAAVVARLVASDVPAYGVTTGFGSLANTRIPPGRHDELQRALVRSHATGMGPPVEERSCGR
jgi:histidine ammonia-lyase